MKIVLASKSPRRIELLRGLGWKFDIIPSEKAEHIDPHLAPKDIAMSLSRQKAEDIASRERNSWVIGADTIVVIDGRVLGKPKDEPDAITMLESLEGKTHEVFTGVTVVSPDGKALTKFARSLVTMKHLTRQEIEAYIACGESMDKAGAYAIQGKGTLLISSIEGDYFNIVGLPLELLSSMFAELGVTLAEQFNGVNEDE